MSEATELEQSVLERNLGVFSDLVSSGAVEKEPQCEGALRAVLQMMHARRRGREWDVVEDETLRDMLRGLVEAGSELDTTVSYSNGTYTPLGMCVQGGNLWALEYLLDSGADPERTDAFTMGGSALTGK